MSATDYLSALRNMNLLVAVNGGQLYAAPAHRLTEPNLRYLNEHAPQIVRTLGECNQANMDLGAYTPVGDRVLFMDPAPQVPQKTGAVSAARPADTDAGDADASPPLPARAKVVDTSVLEVTLHLPASVRRLLDAARHGRLPKGTVNADGHMISDFPGYVQTYTINLLIGDRTDAMKRLTVAAAAVADS